MFFFGTPRKVGVLYNITVSPFSNLKGVFLFVSGGFQPGHRKAAPFRRLSKLPRGDMPKWRFYKALFPRGQGHPPRNFEVHKAQQKTVGWGGLVWGCCCEWGCPRVNSPHLVGGNLSPKYFHQNLKPSIFSMGPRWGSKG